MNILKFIISMCIYKMFQVYEVVADRFDSHELNRLARVISGFSRTKQRCGAVLNCFCQHLTKHETVMFVINFLHYEGIAELEGSVYSLLDEMTTMDEDARAEVISNFSFDARGNIVESDEDEDGNLKYD